MIVLVFATKLNDAVFVLVDIVGKLKEIASNLYTCDWWTFRVKQKLVNQQSACCAFAPKIFGKIPKNGISRHYKTTNKRHLLSTKELVQNASL